MTISAEDWRTAYYVLEWIIRAAALVIVPQRRSPNATRSWLLLIFFLPVPGLVLFWAIGRPQFPAWRRKRFEELKGFLTGVADRLKVQEPSDGAPTDIAELACKLGGFPVTGGNTVELIDDYDGMIDRLVGDIEGAAETVEISVYIFANDTVGRRVVRALGDAVGRGLAVRVMLDPVGSHAWRRGTLRLLRKRGIAVRQALPFRLLRGRTRHDMRYHRKLFVIDGRIGYVGSQNIVGKEFRRGVINRELVARVTGPIVAELTTLVRGDWSLETGEAPDRQVEIPSPTGEATLQLLPSGADYPLEGFETLLVWQLHQARSRVVIATPYFIPDEDVIGAMKTAAARGVAVDLVLSQVVDQRLVNLSQSSYYDDLLAAGIRIHLFREFFLHAKNASIDGSLGLVGSSNVDLRSFQLNQEASLLIYDCPSIAQLERIQQGYLADSEQLDLDRWRRRPLLRKLAENIARLVNSLL
ncbi:MAG: cardiolipin synthase [Novosphingobium sp.]|nr:cardiolipin synthase [Novosphingobium sp.]